MTHVLVFRLSTSFKVIETDTVRSGTYVTVGLFHTVSVINGDFEKQTVCNTPVLDATVEGPTVSIL